LWAGEVLLLLAVVVVVVVMVQLLKHTPAQCWLLKRTLPGGCGGAVLGYALRLADGFILVGELPVGGRMQALVAVDDRFCL
jgi:hypothetical protein